MKLGIISLGFVACLSAAAYTGCSSSKDDGGTAGTANAGGAGGQGGGGDNGGSNSGGGGASGGGATGGAGGAGGMLSKIEQRDLDRKNGQPWLSDLHPATCGAETCQPQDVGGGAWSFGACCVADADKPYSSKDGKATLCGFLSSGLSKSCAPINAPTAAKDPSCPAVKKSMGGNGGYVFADLDGCCIKKSGNCGALDTSEASLGCVDPNSTYNANLPLVKCGGDGGVVTPEAGAPDAATQDAAAQDAAVE